MSLPVKIGRSGIACLVSLVFILNGCKDDPAPPGGVVSCSGRAVFGDTANSPYILPYQVGETYILSQTYCNPTGGHSNQLAYDFALPVGTPVTATREGVVEEVKDDLPDTGNEPDPSLHNHVMIIHEDGTVAFYGHLKQHSILVNKGDTAEAGKIIAQSGNSGNTGNFPHLHLGIYSSWPPREGHDIPFNFRYADGPLDSRGGLVKDSLYRAKPFRSNETSRNKEKAAGVPQ